MTNWYLLSAPLNGPYEAIQPRRLRGTRALTVETSDERCALNMLRRNAVANDLLVGVEPGSPTRTCRIAKVSAGRKPHGALVVERGVPMLTTAEKIAIRMVHHGHANILIEVQA